MTQTRPLGRCLFIARYVPVPSINGGFIYSTQIVQAVRANSEHFTFAGGIHSRVDGDVARAWARDNSDRFVEMEANGRASGYFLGRLPYSAVRFATSANVRHLGALLAAEPDTIVFDHIGTSWALPTVRRWLDTRPVAKRPLVIYASQNVEHELRAAGSPEGSGFVKSVFERFDSARLRRAEHWLSTPPNRVIAITTSDAKTFENRLGAKDVVVINPAYTSAPTSRPVTPDLPRVIALVGSFMWETKRANLEQFLAAGEAIWRKAAIRVRIVGIIDDEHLARYRARWPDVEFTGKVDRIVDHLRDVRIGVVAETAGGGFKLKYLDYVFNDVPIATLSSCVVDIPLADGASARIRDDLPGLWASIVADIDDTALLDHLRLRARADCAAFLDRDHAATLVHRAVLRWRADNAR